MKIVKWIVIVAVLCSCFSGVAQAQGNTIRAASCSSSDVQTAINSASSGDTVTVPGGNCTWSIQVQVPDTKGITLNGQGNTTIYGPQSGSYGSTPLDVSANATTNTFITGFTFTGTGSCDAGNALTIHTSYAPPYTAAIRVYNNNFNAAGTMLCVEGTGPAVIDHNNFNVPLGGGGSEVIHVMGNAQNGWTYDVAPGGPNMIFIETNIFNYAMNTGSDFGGTSAVQNYYASNTVFRYNTIYNMQVDVHGTCGYVWGRWWEIYNNTFHVASGGNQSSYIYIRGGSGVVFNNQAPDANAGVGEIGFYDDCNGTYPDNYQVGRGINETASPGYVWGNGSGIPIKTHSSDIELGRDYFVSSSQPSTLERCQSAADVAAGCPVSYNYTPYTYPHPLTTGSISSVSPPTGLTATVQ